MSAGGRSAGRVEGGVASVCELFRLQLMFQQVYQVLWRVRLISWWTSTGTGTMTGDVLIRDGTEGTLTSEVEVTNIACA